MTSVPRLWFSIWVAVAPLAHAQSSICEIPKELFRPRAENLFTPEQEIYLGEAFAEHLEGNLGVIEDEALASPLRKLGERLSREMSGSGVDFQFFLIDLPFVQAFAAPGGRIYVTRKAVGFARSVDELAFVLGHEMGHAATGDVSAKISDAFRRILGVTQVSDREDVHRRYRELAAKQSFSDGRVEKDEHGAQVSADRIGVLAAVRAGFALDAPVAFWDRLAETEGAKGNWLSDLFGFTSLESKRLREMVDLSRAIPPGCRGERVPDLDTDFARWKSALVLHTGSRGERLSGIVSRAMLAPALRPDLEHLRFSPDGNFLIAQDKGSLFVLHRQGLSLSFRVDAPDAERAQFSLDSQNVWFHTRDLKIHQLQLDETGGLSGHVVNEVFRRDPCSTSSLARNGKVLACQSYDGDLVLYDVSTGSVLLRKPGFYPTTGLAALGDQFFIGRQAGPNMGFSQDGKHFIAAFAGADLGTLLGLGQVGSGPETHYLAFDVEGKEEMKLPGSIRDRIGRGFVFQGTDRIIGVHLDPEKSAVLTFPEGKTIAELPLGYQDLDLPARGDYVFLRPVKKAAVGVMDLGTKKIFLASQKPAFDVYENLLASQLPSGEVEILDHRKRESVASLELPQSPLGALRAVAISSDAKWIATSGPSRGGLWSTTTGERAFETRGFESAWFDEVGRAYAVFPSNDETGRLVGILETASGQQFAGPTLDDEKEFQHGGVLLSSTRDNGNSQLSARSVRSGSVLWRMDLGSDVPQMSLSPVGSTFVLLWSGSGKYVASQIEADERLAQMQSSVGKGKGRLIEVFDLATRKLLARALVGLDLGVATAFASGGDLVVSDFADRILVYRLEDGSRKGTWFGRRPSHSPALGLLAVERTSHEIALYRSGSAVASGTLSFASPISFARFSDDGTRLIVLTNDQSIFVLDPSAL